MVGLENFIRGVLGLVKFKVGVLLLILSTLATYGYGGTSVAPSPTNISTNLPPVPAYTAQPSPTTTPTEQLLHTPESFHTPTPDPTATQVAPTLFPPAATPELPPTQPLVATQVVPTEVLPTATPVPPPTATTAPVPTATPVPPPTATTAPVPTATPVPPARATTAPVPTATPVPLPDLQITDISYNFLNVDDNDGTTSYSLLVTGTYGQTKPNKSFDIRLLGLEGIISSDHQVTHINNDGTFTLEIPKVSLPDKDSPKYIR